MKNIKRIVLGLSFLIALLCVSACSDSYRSYEEKIKIKQCSDSGGIPILSEWDGRLANCIYPPSK